MDHIFSRVNLFFSRWISISPQSRFPPDLDLFPISMFHLDLRGEFGLACARLACSRAACSCSCAACSCAACSCVHAVFHMLAIELQLAQGSDRSSRWMREHGGRSMERGTEGTKCFTWAPPPISAARPYRPRRCHGSACASGLECRSVKGRLCPESGVVVRSLSTVIRRGLDVHGACVRVPSFVVA